MNELVTEGGEVAFIEKIITSSLRLKDRVTWYSSMIGKKVDLKTIGEFSANFLRIFCEIEFSGKFPRNFGEISVKFQDRSDFASD